MLTAARIYGRLSFLPERGPTIARVHRWSGRIAFLCTLPVFFHCVTILGFQTPDARVALHAIVGTFFYGVFAAKVLIVRDHSLPGWALPTAGLTLASMLGRALADLEPLVLHDRAVRLLMGRGWRPILIGGAVVVGTFALAKAQIFEPSAPAGVAVAGGDVYRGETIFQRECSGCHGDGGKGGGVGPDARSRPVSTAAEVAAAVQQGRGVMPAGLVSGQEQADVVAYVVSDLEPRRVVSADGGRGSDRPTAARGDVRHRARGDRLRGRRPRLVDARGRDRLRRGGADRALRRVGAVGACEFVDEHGRIVGDDPFALEEIGERLGSIPGEQAAKSALDAALHDLQGKLLGVPAFRLLGLPRTGPPTSWTIWLGDPDDMARRAEKAGDDVPAAEAQARRGRRPRRRARARRSRRHRPPAAWST